MRKLVTCPRAVLQLSHMIQIVKGENSLISLVVTGLYLTVPTALGVMLVPAEILTDTLITITTHCTNNKIADIKCFEASHSILRTIPPKSEVEPTTPVEGARMAAMSKFYR